MTRLLRQRDYDNAIRDLVFKAILVPVFILVGMYMAGSMIGDFLGISNTFGTIFAAVGGFPTVGYYFYRLWKEYTK